MSSLITTGCESVEGAAPDERSPVCEGNRQGQRKGTRHHMRCTLQEVHSTGGDQTLQHVNRKTQGKRGMWCA